MTRAMPENFVYSDEPCCFRCSRLYFDIDKGDCCKWDGHQVKPYLRACEHFNEICGRFGGWTKPEKPSPQQLTLF